MFEGAARSVQQSLERLRQDGTPVKIKGGILDIIGGEIEVGRTKENLAARVNNLPPERAGEMLERLVEKLGESNLSEQMLTLGQQRQLELSVDRATQARNVQVMLFGLQLNIGGKTNVNFEQSESILADLVVAREGGTEKAPNKFTNWQFNVGGFQLNEFDDVAVNVRFRKGANIATAVYNVLGEMGI